MLRNLKNILRIGAGLILLMIGIIGLIIPILQGWLLILIAIPIISPKYGKKMITKVKEKIYAFRRRDPDRQP